MPGPTRKQVFISCVTAEFGSYRERLRIWLKQPHIDVHVQEDFVPATTPALEQINDYIRHSDVIVHLAGDMTGARANPYSLDAVMRVCPGIDRLQPIKAAIERDPTSISHTQWEAYLALYHRKPLLIATPYDWTPRDNTFVKDGAQMALQKEHFARLRRQTGTVCASATLRPC
jgi:hypothetical protein